MKEKIITLEKDWMEFLYGLIGVLLILFPEPLTEAIPYLLGLGMVVQGIAGVIVVFK